MRVSPVARFVSHPTMQFFGPRDARLRPRLGLRLTPSTTYHPAVRRRHGSVTVGLLRCETSRFRFPSVGRSSRTQPHRAALSLGTSRGRRA